MKIVVVGGGTAGWISALKIKKEYPNYSITVIESSAIGVLGAGEATVSNFSKLIVDLDIDPEELLIRSKATLKNGVKFVNWNAEKIDYMIGFSAFGGFLNKDILSVALNLLNQKGHMEDINLYAQLSEQNKLPIRKDELDKFLNDKEYRFRVYKRYAWQFDASLVAAYFKEVALTRGIKVIDAKVFDFISNENNDITSVIFEDGSNESCDFIVDCSGFKRLVIGKFYNSEWTSFKEYLPVDSALAFFLPPTHDIPSHTQIMAMNYGWNFQIPLHHRVGSGYVYDSRFISEEEAEKEIKEVFGDDIKIINKFKFEAGHYKNSWRNNAIAIGLSGGFIEPMEATAILIATESIGNALMFSDGFKNNTPEIQNKFNELFENKYKDCVDFIATHYITNKTDNDFWTKFTENNKISKNLQNFIDSINSDITHLIPDNIQAWSGDFFKVYFGNHMYNKELLSKYVNNIDHKKIDKLQEDMINYTRKATENYITNREFVDYIINKKDKGENI